MKRCDITSSVFRCALALQDLIVLLVVAVLCATVLILTFTRYRPLARIAACENNLHQIGTALYTYAATNREMFPVAAHLEATEDRVGEVEYVRAIGSYRGRASNPGAGNTDRMSPRPEQLSTTRNLWTLFRLGLIERDKFICPSTKDVANQEPNAKNYWDFGVGDIDGPATPQQSRVGYSQVSYGYQVPYGKRGQPDTEHDKNCPVADKGPFGAAYETDAPLPPIVFPRNTDPPAAWRPWNSPNHHREGQVVMYADTHTDFQTKPTAGWGGENIYTQWGAEAPHAEGRWYAGATGTGPSPGARLTPAPIDPRVWAYDGLIYP